jgi:hypothetical protein
MRSSPREKKDESKEMEMTKMIRKISMVGVCMALTGAAQAALITNNFTSAEGFTAGALDGQQGWISQHNWSVSPTGSGKATVSLQNRSAVYTTALKMSDGDSLTFRTEFKLLGAPVIPSASVNIMSFGVRTDAALTVPTAGSGDSALLRVLQTSGNLQLGGVTLGTIADHGLAILAAEYTLTVGADAATSLFGWKLINIDTSASVSGSSVMSAATFNALTGDGAYTYFRSNTHDNNSSGITGIDVFSTTVIPEPATIGMLGMGALITLLIRRMKK